jgi:hypothetical protein
MKRMMIGILTFCAFAAGAFAQDGLEKRFANPPDGTKPRCYWYWLDGHISKEGITRDLEAMKRVGIGEGYIGIINGQSGSAPNPDLKSLSDEWWGYIEHAVREGGRIGVDIGLFNCPGWSQSGGPWIKHGQAMRYVTQQEMRVAGGKHFEGKLPQPNGDFQDLAVLAFPAPAHDADDAAARGAKMTREPKAVTFEFAAPFEARSLVVHPSKQVRVEAELQVSDDGQQFKPLRKFVIDRHNLSVQVGPVPLAPIAISFPAVSARYFKLVFSGPCELGNVVLSSAARLESYSEKQLAKVFQDPLPPADFYTWQTQTEPDSKDLMIQAEAVLDISKQMNKDGVLSWDVPQGNWIVLRTVLMPTGTKNTPAPSDATGLEVDKMNREALKAHFNAYLGKLVARMPAKDRKAWKHVVADSYETGPQNWTDGMAADFRKCYGYDPLPYLPVLTGRIVGSAEMSDRFLWDLRRMVADRISRDYVGGLRDLCHENGLKMWLENYGHWGFPGEFLQYGGNCDEISGEFWVGGNLGSIELRDASSAAHTYGKPVVFAEAFTGGPAFESTPASLKARGDWSFCEGVNQFVLHVYVHQPWEDKRPGVDAGFGTEFNRHNTWFEYSGAWIDYLRRCSVMLQAGKHVADVAYYIGEDTPKMAGSRRPELPVGYNYDYINAEVIEKSLKVSKGRFVLPDGMSYSLLVLPEKTSMRPAVLKKIRDLVKDGGTVLGPMPTKSPSLQNYPACDAEVAGLASELWGKGQVLTHTDLKTALVKLGIGPDVTCPGDVLWTHRRDGDTDIYFLSNQRGDVRTEQIGFRAGGRAPEFWWPETGRRERPAVYEAGENLVTVPVPFGPNTSVFVVFREKARTDSLVAATVDGKSVFEVQPLNQNGQLPEIKGLPAELTFGDDGKLNLLAYRSGSFEVKTAAGVTRKLEVAAVPAPVELGGPWQVSFDAKAGGPEKPVTFEKLEDWSKRPEEGIKYYSGTAVYRKTFDLPAEFSRRNSVGNAKLHLDLGEVRDMVRVRVNGKDAGTVWKPPYRLDMTGLVKDGKNMLEIDVVNTWFNRLIGDAQPGVGNKVSFTTFRRSDPKCPLKPAGLIGPVILQVAAEAE